MSLNESLREQLIKQFDADVSVIKDRTGVIHYVCPSCQRNVSINEKKCHVCDQMLNWDHLGNIEPDEQRKNIATITFEVSSSFEKSDCGRCPISHVVKRAGYEEHECPLGNRTDCPIEIR